MLFQSLILRTLIFGNFNTISKVIFKIVDL